MPPAEHSRTRTRRSPGADDPDRAHRLDPADRWTSDILRVSTSAGAFIMVEADMSRPAQLIRALAAQGEKVTYTAVFVRACALALARHPDLNVVVGATRSLRPGRVDIGLSVAGETACAPLMVIQDAAHRSVSDIAEEIRVRTPQVLEKERRDLAWLRRWGWLLPFSALRTTLLRTALRRPRFRRSMTGTFQVTTVRTADALVPLCFVATGALSAGAVRDRVVAVDGAPAVRPGVTLVCSFDHKVWDGARAARFLAEVQRTLEGADHVELMQASSPSGRPAQWYQERPAGLVE